MPAPPAKPVPPPNYATIRRNLWEVTAAPKPLRQVDVPVCSCRPPLRAPAAAAPAAAAPEVRSLPRYLVLSRPCLHAMQAAAAILLRPACADRSI